MNRMALIPRAAPAVVGVSGSRESVRLAEGPMAVGQFNSSLCQITWTEAVHGTQRFAFRRAKPLTLRFGLQIAPTLWSSSTMCFIDFEVYFRGYFSYLKDFFVPISELPGAPSEELWIGLSLGQAGQLTENGTGIATFRPKIWFTVGANEFAVAREDCHFVITHGSSYDADGYPFEKLVGGSGQPKS